MKKISCNVCNIKRKLMIKATVRDQKEEIEAGYNWLCFYCLLKIMGLVTFSEKTEVNRKAIMQDIEKEE